MLCCVLVWLQVLSLFTDCPASFHRPCDLLGWSSAAPSAGYTLHSFIETSFLAASLSVVLSLLIACVSLGPLPCRDVKAGSGVTLRQALWLCAFVQEAPLDVWAPCAELFILKRSHTEHLSLTDGVCTEPVLSYSASSPRQHVVR